MTRLDHDCVMATATVILQAVQHMLWPEEQREYFGIIFAALEACLIRRDEMLARERKRLGKPSDK